MAQVMTVIGIEIQKVSGTTVMSVDSLAQFGSSFRHSGVVDFSVGKPVGHRSKSIPFSGLNVPENKDFGCDTIRAEFELAVAVNLAFVKSLVVRRSGIARDLLSIGRH